MLSRARTSNDVAKLALYVVSKIGGIGYINAALRRGNLQRDANDAMRDARDVDVVVALSGGGDCAGVVSALKDANVRVRRTVGVAGPATAVRLRV